MKVPVRIQGSCRFVGQVDARNVPYNERQQMVVDGKYFMFVRRRYRGGMMTVMVRNLKSGELKRSKDIP